jgi:hypothetical protein
VRGWWVLALGSLACGSAEGGGSDGRTTFSICRGRDFSPAPKEDFRHTSSTLVAAQEPNHSAQDVIATPDERARLVGKLTYGALGTDLEDEDVRVWIDDCDGWRDLGDHTTDSDGRIALDVPFSLGPGAYDTRFQVLGDQSATAASVWVLPPGTRVVLTDIDGTLTASDSELFMQVLDGTHTPVAYAGAVDLTVAHEAGGYVIVYLTGRPYWLTQRTRDWTSDLGFAPGPLHVADSNEEALPGESGVGAYKLAWIEGLLAQGYSIDFAYGNASTDIFAYLGAGIDAERVWIIGTHAGESGTHGATDTWEPRVDEVRALESVTQPFSAP